jgi:hypothetical protein
MDRFFEPFHVDRLYQVFDKTRIQANGLITRLDVTGQRDRRNVAVRQLSQLPDEVDPISIRQADVADQHVEMFGRTQQVSLRARGGGPHDVRAMLKQPRKNRRGVVMIFDQQYSHEWPAVPYKWYRFAV